VDCRYRKGRREQRHPKQFQEEDQEAREFGDIVGQSAALKKSGWKIYGRGGAAERPGIKPATLSSRIKKWGLKN